MIEEYKDIDAKMFHFETWVGISNIEFLKSTFQEILIKAKFSIVNFVEHHFPVKGYTCVWVLAESHLAIHTFPTKNKTYIQISSCNEDKLKIFKKTLSAINF